MGENSITTFDFNNEGTHQWQVLEPNTLIFTVYYTTILSN